MEDSVGVANKDFLQGSLGVDDELRSITFKGEHDMSVISRLHTKCHKLDDGDVGTLFRSPTNRSGEPLSKSPTRM